jgi:hypothetical protein
MRALRLVEKPRETFADVNARRGYVPVYQSAMRCPGCSRSHWHVGRLSAECHSCGCALPLEAANG